MLKADVKPAAQYWIDNVKSKMTGREGRRDRLRQAGEMDHGAGEHHEIRRVHARRRQHQGEARKLEGPVLPRGARPARQLNAGTLSPAGHGGRHTMHAPSGPTPLLQVERRHAAIQDRAAPRHRHLSRQLRRLPAPTASCCSALGLRQVDPAQGGRRLHGADRGQHAPQGRADPRARAPTACSCSRSSTSCCPGRRSSRTSCSR